MERTQWLQETRKVRFEEAYSGWQDGRLTQEEAALLLGLCARSFRRYIDRYEEAGMDGLIDKRMNQISQRRAPVDEVMGLTERYRQRHLGWSAKHFHAWYRKDGGTRSYTWVKQALQTAGLIVKAPKEYNLSPATWSNNGSWRLRLVHLPLFLHSYVASGCFRHGEL